MSPDSVTSWTLLGRLQQSPTDQTAWGDFVARYGGKIEGWCKYWGLQPTDVQDVTQNVLLKLAKRMSDCPYKGTGRFRGWLKTVAYHAFCDYIKQQQRPGGGTGDSDILRMLQSVEAREDLLRQLDDECRRELLEEAMKRVRARVQANTWEAFRLMTFEHLSGAETAEQLQMKKSSVFVAKSRVDHMLSEEVRRLDCADE